MVEIIDSHDQVLLLMGKERAEAQKLPHRWVLAAFYDRAGRLWLRRVVPQTPGVPAYLDFSVRAHVLSGEARESTVERLLEKELGISGTQPLLRAVFPLLEGEDRRHFSLFIAGRRGMQALPTASGGLFLDKDELAGLAEHFPDLLHPSLLWCIREAWLG